MLGAIIGDMVGSKYEFHPLKRKDFDIYDPKMRMTDDSFLTIAVAKTLLKNYPIKYSKESLEKIKSDLVDAFVDAWRFNKDAGFGGMFYRWCVKASHGVAEPYNSFGNGSAMRISPVGWMANSEDEVILLSKAVTEITHNHPEGILGAEAVAMAIYLALHGSNKEEIKKRMVRDYYPEIEYLNFDDLVAHYDFVEICQESVPQAIYCFLISNSLEDAIRNCVAIGGDCDTIGAMAGAIAEAYYQKEELSELEIKYLNKMIDPDVKQLIKDFHSKLGNKKFNNI